MSKTKIFTIATSLLAAWAVMSPQYAYADNKSLGLGLVVGAPSGLSGKMWLDDVHAIDFALGSFGYYVGTPYSGINLHVDYLWHRFGVFGTKGSDVNRRLPMYVGVGGMFSSPGAAGVRGVLGVTYLFQQPFDVFFELAPTLVVAPGMGFGTDAGLGGRFYF
jgi:hypothetical protein